jgi:hypothetical protein
MYLDGAYVDEEDQRCVVLAFIGTKILLNFAESLHLLGEVTAHELCAFILEVKKTAIREHDVRARNASMLQSAGASVETNAIDSGHPFDSISNYLYRVAMKQETLLETSLHLRVQEGVFKAERLLRLKVFNLQSAALKKWMALVGAENAEKMDEDRECWRSHATANMETDLQAWYHAVFHTDVYRLRGSFWYRSANLPTYRTNYELVDSGLSAKEEQALAGVLCSPDTTYGDVAGQMFIVQACMPSHQYYLLFQVLD